MKEISTLGRNWHRLSSTGLPLCPLDPSRPLGAPVDPNLGGTALELNACRRLYLIDYTPYRALLKPAWLPHEVSATLLIDPLSPVLVIVGRAVVRCWCRVRALIGDPTPFSRPICFPHQPQLPCLFDPPLHPRHRSLYTDTLSGQRVCNKYRLVCNKYRFHSLCASRQIHQSSTCGGKDGMQMCNY